MSRVHGRGPSVLASTGAAIVSRFVRVILTRRPMAEKDHQPGETLGKADHSQLSLNDADLLIQRKSKLLSRGLGCVGGIRRIDRE